MTVYVHIEGDTVDLRETESAVVGVPPEGDAEGWRRAMQDPRFVRDQAEFLELTEDADSEVLDGPTP
jgi:hypothetical protein